VEKTPVMLSFTGKQPIKELEDRAFNIEMNLFSGVEPKDLQKDEIEILKRKYGENWFYELGYDDSWEKPIFK